MNPLIHQLENIRDMVNNKLTKDEVKILLDKVMEVVNNKTISMANIISITTDLMSILGKINDLNGKEKKKLVIQLLYILIEEFDAGSLEIFDPILKELVPIIIDNLISVEKGKIKFNKQGYCAKLFTCYE